MPGRRIMLCTIATSVDYYMKFASIPSLWDHWQLLWLLLFLSNNFWIFN